MSQPRRIAAISLMFAVLLAVPAVGQYAQYYVLDGFGGFRVAKAISYRNVPPRAAGDEFYGSFSVSNSGFLAMNTIAIHAPDDGFLLIMTTTTVGCASTGPTSVLTDLALTVDTTSVTGVPIWRVRIPGSDCVSFHTETMTGTRLVPVSAGSHTVLLMARDAGGGTFGSMKTRTMTALFVDQDELGGS